MSPAFAVLALLVFVGVLLALPMLPAFVELHLKRDAQPLNVIQQYEGEIRFFSYGFRSCINGLQQSLMDCVASGTTATGQLPHGDRYFLLGRPGTADFTPAELEGSTCPLVVLAGSDVILPDGLTFAKEIYAAGNLVGGKHCGYRAILGERDIELGASSKVMRWAHAAGRLHAESNCNLYGRVSSDHTIHLQAGCIFQRLNAPLIALGCAEAFDTQRVSENGDAVGEPTLTRRLVEGDLQIPPGEVVNENLVVRGNLHIGDGARITGNVKANKKIEVASGVCIDGSLISAEAAHIGPGCWIYGPIVAEHGISIDSHTECGTMQNPTTVSATTIEAQEGVMVFGTLWAREEGRVVPST